MVHHEGHGEHRFKNKRQTTAFCFNLLFESFVFFVVKMKHETKALSRWEQGLYLQIKTGP